MLWVIRWYLRLLKTFACSAFFESGMDPVSRRFVLKHVNEITPGRVILLTTHAMEEADLLADNVAIMRNGEIAAFGSPLELKCHHGSTLQFSVSDLVFAAR